MTRSPIQSVGHQSVTSDASGNHLRLTSYDDSIAELLREGLDAAQGDIDRLSRLASVVVSINDLRLLAESIENDGGLDSYPDNYPRGYIQKLRDKVLNSFDICVRNLYKIEDCVDKNIALRLSEIVLYNARLCSNIIDRKIFIIKKETNPFVDLDAFVERMAKDVRDGLARYAHNKSNAREIFQRIAEQAGVSESSSLGPPAEPPMGQLYATRLNSSETPPEFIERVYGAWLTGEFTRADLRKIDRQAEMGLRNWERINGRALINLPTKQERNDALAANPDLLSSPQVKEVRRLQKMVSRRKSKKHDMG